MKAITALLFVLMALAITNAVAQLQHGVSPAHSTPLLQSANPRALAHAQASLTNGNAVYVENHGQWDARAKYLLRSAGMDLWITATGVVYDFHRVDNIASKRNGVATQQSATAGKRATPPPVKVSRKPVFLTFEGAHTGSHVAGTGQRSGYQNYFVGNNPSAWTSGVPTYNGTRMENIYDGVDAVFYVDNGRPRYDLVLSPGADPAKVHMNIEGADKISIDAGGSLVIHTAFGDVQQKELVAYQTVAGEKHKVECGFINQGSGAVGFKMGNYDKAKPLVIDPLIYSTYVGGGDDDIATGIAVDAGGNAYITGFTYSSNFPTTNSLTTLAGGADAFVAKLSNDGSTLLYATYLGGTNDDEANAIALDGSGNAHVAGFTSSTDFPMQHAYQPANGGGQDIFVATLSNDGSALLNSTYLGGASDDVAWGIAADAVGNAYIAGTTLSNNYPAVHAFNAVYSGAGYEAILTKLSSDGASLAYSTYFGGNNDDAAYSVAINANGNAYVTGHTSSTNFPISAGALKATHTGSDLDIFVTEFSADGTALVYSTYLGGSGNEEGYGIALNGSGSAYVSGYTTSPDFPTTAGAAQAAYGGSPEDAFVAKVNADGSALTYSTFIGGHGDDVGYSIAVDAIGNAYITGSTTSTNFPTANAYQAAFSGGYYDAFVTKLNSAGSALSYSTYLGGNDDEIGYGVAVDHAGNAYATGFTYSTDYPVSSAAYLTSNGGGSDAFVTKLGSDAHITVTSPNTNVSWCAGSTQTLTWTSASITNVMIELSGDGGISWSTLASSTLASSGSYNWVIPSTQAAGTNNIIRMSDATNALVYDVSDASFTIVTGQPVLIGVPTDATAGCDNIPAAAAVTATDNCDNNPIVTLHEISTQAVSLSDAGHYNYVITRTWTATDAFGNSSSASQTINVADATKPVLIGVPSNTTASCDNIPAAVTVTATDNCDAAPAVVLQTTTTQSSSLSDAGHYNYSITRTWTATDAAGNSVSQSQLITVHDITAPMITAPPDVTYCPGATVVLGSPTNISDNCDANPTVSNNAPTTYSAGTTQITWTVKDASGNSATATQIVTITTAPVAGANPSNAAVCNPATATFTTSAGSGSPAPTIKWQVNSGSGFADITPAETNTSLNILSTSSAYQNGYSFRAAFTNSCGVVYSTAATLTVNASPAITSNPNSATLCAGQKATFSVTATGNGITYQWRKNSANISGATSSGYVINSVCASDAGSYDVVISGTCSPSMTSTAATLAVNALPAISANPNSATMCAGQKATFSVTATGTAITYQWRKNSANISGATSSSYAINSVSASDAGSYDVVISGTCTPSITSSTATLTVNTSPTITTNPASTTVCAGSSVSFTAAASGSPSPTVQWQVYSSCKWQNISGATQSPYTFTSSSCDDGKQFRVVATNTCGSATSTAATLSVNVPPTASLTVTGKSTILAGSSTTIKLTLTGFGKWTVKRSDQTSASVVGTTGASSYCTTFTVTPSTTTTYSITSLSDAGGCTATDFGCSVKITVKPSCIFDMYCAEHEVSGSGSCSRTLKHGFQMDRFGIYDQSKVSSDARTYLSTLGNGASACSDNQVDWEMIDPSSGNFSDAQQVTYGGGPALHYKVRVPSDVSLEILGTGSDQTSCQLGSVLNGGPAGSASAGTTAVKYLQSVVSTDKCKSAPATTTVLNGSLLLIVEPQYLEFTSDTEYLPVVYESVEGDWNVDVSIDPPDGFVNQTDSTFSMRVSDSLVNYSAVQFAIQDTGSDWTTTRIKHAIQHKGKSIIVEGYPAMINLQTGYRSHQELLLPHGGSAPGSSVLEFALHQNYPDPFNPTTTVAFDVKKTSTVSVVVYDQFGRVVTTLADGEISAGQYTVNFDATGLASGIYLCRMTAGAFAETKVMTLIK